MSRTPLLGQLIRAMRIARYCNDRHLPTQEGIDELRRAAEREAPRRASRRQVLALGAAAAAGAALSALPRPGRAAPRGSRAISVGVVGAGLAGLACAYELRKAGVIAQVYEASDRVGGRCYSMGGAFPGPVTFPGQIIERGGELIDTTHNSMQAYAKEFGLALEDITKGPGEVFYYFDGRRYPESAVVDQYRDLVAAMRADLRRLSAAPSADSHTADDVALDNMSLAEYLDSRGAAPLIKKAITAAYIAEYGLEAAQQGCLGFLLFIHADRRSKFTPFGIFSDERFHVVSGNQGIATGLRDRVPDQVLHGQRLESVARRSSGQIEVGLRAGGRSVTAVHDAVVLAIPFTVLRGVRLDATLGLPQWKVDAIQRLGYGTNAKMMVGFNGPFWLGLGCDGASYSDLPNHQATWETNPTRATAAHAVLTDYSGGDRGARLDPRDVQREARRFVADLDRVMPGALGAVARDGTSIRAHLEHWPSNPLSLGSYTCYLPGQFTSIAGNEGKRVGHLHFAGEHANSFYEWQGFMEGALLSGKQAAAEILGDLKAGAI